MRKVIGAVGGGLLGAGIVLGTMRLYRTGSMALLQGASMTTPLPPGSAAVAIRQIRRYAFAASQDRSPVVGLTHASYALILLDTLEEMVGRDAIKRGGYDVGKVRAFITKLQDAHAERLRACDDHLTNMLAIEAGEGAIEPGLVAGAYAAPTGA